MLLETFVATRSITLSMPEKNDLAGGGCTKGRSSSSSASSVPSAGALDTSSSCKASAFGAGGGGLKDFSAGSVSCRICSSIISGRRGYRKSVFFAIGSVLSGVRQSVLAACFGSTGWITFLDAGFFRPAGFRTVDIFSGGDDFLGDADGASCSPLGERVCSLVPFDFSGDLALVGNFLRVLSATDDCGCCKTLVEIVEPISTFTAMGESPPLISIGTSGDIAAEEAGLGGEPEAGADSDFFKGGELAAGADATLSCSRVASPFEREEPDTLVAGAAPAERGAALGAMVETS